MQTITRKERCATTIRSQGMFSQCHRSPQNRPANAFQAIASSQDGSSAVPNSDGADKSRTPEMMQQIFHNSLTYVILAVGFSSKTITSEWYVKYGPSHHMKNPPNLFDILQHYSTYINHIQTVHGGHILVIFLLAPSN